MSEGWSPDTSDIGPWNEILNEFGKGQKMPNILFARNRKWKQLVTPLMEGHGPALEAFEFRMRDVKDAAKLNIKKAPFQESLRSLIERWDEWSMPLLALLAQIIPAGAREYAAYQSHIRALQKSEYLELWSQADVCNDLLREHREISEELGAFEQRVQRVAQDLETLRRKLP